MGCCNKHKSGQIELLSNSKNDKENILIPIQTTKSNNIKKSIKIKSVKGQQPKKMKFSDFEALNLLGKGTFGQVLLVKFKDSTDKNLYAMKILDKHNIKEKNQQEHTKNERDLMVKISSPFIASIKFAFQDNKNLYLVSEFMQGGELFFHLKNTKRFTEELTRFYAMEIVLGLAAIHEINAVYRDLKPEKILLDSKGHIRLTDFGLSKIVKGNDGKAYTLCGTMRYLAPEVLMHQGYKKEVDWWSLGSVVYLMLEGRPPFGNPKSENLNMNTYHRELIFFYTKSEEAKNFIKELLVVEPNKRLGSGENGTENIQKHPFFKGIDWKKAYRKEYTPPFVPKLEDELDLQYFDRSFTEEPIDINSIQDDGNNSRINEEYYNNFSFNDS